MDATTTPNPSVDVAHAPAIAGLRFRRYRPDDVGALAALQEVVEVADQTFEILGEAALANELANLADFDAPRDILLAEVDGRLVAASRRIRMVRDGAREFTTFGWVHPDWRRRGLGLAMLRHAEAELRARAAAEEAAGETRAAHLGSWSFDQATGAVALLESEGYRPIRWFLEMVRPLDAPIPDRGLPDGLELRPVLESRCARPCSPRTPRPSRTTGAPTRRPRRTSGASSVTRTTICRCGSSPGPATTSSARSSAASTRPTTRPRGSGRRGSTGSASAGRGAARAWPRP